MRKIGFSGTQKGMTYKQGETLLALLSRDEINEFHHGDCIGADAEAHEIAKACRIPIYIHPPLISEKRAYKHSRFTFPPEMYLERNHNIIDLCNILIACPSSRSEEMRSGTWATIRYARKKNKEIKIIWPDGKIKREDKKC